jgi:hypothetical protein
MAKTSALTKRAKRIATNYGQGHTYSDSCKCESCERVRLHKANTLTPHDIELVLLLLEEAAEYPLAERIAHRLHQDCITHEMLNSVKLSWSRHPLFVGVFNALRDIDLGWRKRNGDELTIVSHLARHLTE